MHSLHKKLQFARITASTTLSVAVISSLGYQALKQLAMHDKKQEKLISRSTKIEHEAAQFQSIVESKVYSQFVKTQLDFSEMEAARKSKLEAE